MKKSNKQHTMPSRAGRGVARVHRCCRLAEGWCSVPTMISGSLARSSSDDAAAGSKSLLIKPLPAPTPSRACNTNPPGTRGSRSHRRPRTSSRFCHRASASSYAAARKLAVITRSIWIIGGQFRVWQSGCRGTRGVTSARRRAGNGRARPSLGKSGWPARLFRRAVAAQFLVGASTVIVWIRFFRETNGARVVWV
jgi:hypothetical protein